MNHNEIVRFLFCDFLVARFFPVTHFSFPAWEQQEGRIRAPKVHRIPRRRSLLEEKQWDQSFGESSKGRGKGGSK